ncbi:MAG: OmpA family protein [Myxococcales bacterium]|jgi:outer membrane protein OmpA-like peptidoglycan-associated protein|nr:OmpA family protein [Myxococcales bacterium]
MSLSHSASASSLASSASISSFALFGVTCLAFASGLVAAGSAARADALDFTLKSKVLATEKERPHIALQINEPLDFLTLILERADGQKFEHRYERVEANGRTRIDLPLAKGVSRAQHFKARFELGIDGEIQHHEFEFDAEIIAQPKITVRPEDVNVDGGFLSLTSDRDISRIDANVFSEEGRLIAQKSQRFGLVPAGSKAEILWGPTEQRVFKIALKIYDTDDFFTGLELIPWRFDIPHDEVNFVSGSAEIAKAEWPKLEASIHVLGEVLKRMGRSANLSLYILGATDTVGAAEANQKLSAARALAIGRYFRSRGIRIPIFTAGLGEEGLRVATADEVDELQNRRADYIVTVEPPVLAPGTPPVSWKKMP